jgi:UDP-N-acetylglucosamine 2-epimerase (non-hydrolysing)/GDP/UDP-N,N'-diacetylbacillosamine 2-epimerase (hydrolysing)
VGSVSSLRLLAVTGSRADFGLWLPVLEEARRRGSAVDARLLVTAMHLDARFGRTVEEVRRSGHMIAAEVPCTPEGDGRVEMAAAIGRAIVGMAPVIADRRPDWLLVLGDRGEQLAAAIAALHAGVATAHLHGGEVTRGVVDDTVRDLVTRVANLHLVATEDAASRLEAMGEEPWRIHRVGAPGLDQLRAAAAGDLAGLRGRYGLPAEGPYLVLVQHPETVGEERAERDLEATLEAVRTVGLPALAVYPNADAGGRAMIERLRRVDATLPAVASLPRGEFATLLSGAAALVGNSSSGIIEAPLLGVPAVNVGRRQEGRTRGDNVIDVPAEPSAIADAIRRATDSSFRATLSGTSPYGSGDAAARILDVLAGTPRDERLRAKRPAGSAG